MNTQTKTLNQGQQEAADGFFEFLFSPERELIISGGGGTGKTHLLGHLIDKVIPDYRNTCRLMNIEPEYDTVEMTSTTNKAAEVLSIATGQDTKTAASFLSLTVKNDYQTGRSKLAKTQNWKVHSRKILVCDECSMIDPPLDLAMQEGTHKCKIVYVGDHCQLAPVGYESSPIYQRPMPFFELTEPMRNAGQPALMAVCEQLRETVKTGIFKPILQVDNVIDYLDDAEMIYAIDYVFKQPVPNSRIIAYTNQRVVDYNDYIREMRGLSGEYVEGEALVNAQAITLGKQGVLSVEAEVEIVEQSRHIERLIIEDKSNTYLEVRRCTLQTARGKRFVDVPLPVDRDHYNELLRYYGRTKNWSRHYFIKETVPDLRPRDAATYYKVQGSTYDSVFIDLGNISTCNKPAEVARALYVAFSRAQTRVFLHGVLPPKYSGGA